MKFLLTDKSVKALALFAVFCLVVVASAVSITKAANPQDVTINIDNATLNFGSGGGSAPAADDLGAYNPTSSGTHFVDLDVTGSARIQKDFESQATSTLQEITLGSRFSKSMTFTAGVTTTPGAVMSLQNTGSRKLCTRVFHEITANGGAGSITLKTATSTSASDFPFYLNASGLVASSTVPTSTTGIVTQSSSPTTPWIWDTGVYLNTAIDAGFYSSHKQGNASSTVYTSDAGKTYVQCITQ